MKIVKRSNDYLELEAVGEDPALFDSLSELAQRIDGVEYAGITIEHPLTRKIIMRIKSNPSKVKAEDALRQAIEELKDTSRELREKFEKI